MPKTLAAADGSFAAIQFPQTGEKANAQTAPTGAGLEELFAAPVTERLVDVRERVADIEPFQAIAEGRLPLGVTDARYWFSHATHPASGVQVDGALGWECIAARNAVGNPTDDVYIPLELVQGASIDYVYVAAKAVANYTALPALMPAFEVIEYDPGTDTATTIINATEDTSATVAAFNAAHRWQASPSPHPVVNASRRYSLRFIFGTGESGAVLALTEVVVGLV